MWEFCKICGSKATVYIKNINSYIVLRCESCETYFSISLKEKEDLYDYTNEKTHSRIELNNVIEIIDLLQCVCHRGLNILEIGCGDLRHLVKLRKLFSGVALYGYDLNYSTEIINKAENYGIKLLRSLDNSESGKRMHLIFGFHVLEHVKEPIEFIESLKKMLIPGGYILLSVPNPTRISKTLFSEDWDNPPYHYYKFAEKTFSVIAQKTNLKLISIKKYPLSLKYDLYIYIENMKQKLYEVIKYIKKRSFFGNETKNDIYRTRKFSKVINQQLTKNKKKFLHKFIYLKIFNSLSYFLSIIYFFSVKLKNLRKKDISLSMLITLRYFENYFNERQNVVFDFDGTLILKDSYMEFLFETFKGYLRYLIILLQLLYRLGILNNFRFKKITWLMIPKHRKTQEYFSIFVGHLNKYINNHIFEKLLLHIKQNDNVFIISASYNSWIKEFFAVKLNNFLNNRNIIILASSFMFNERDKLNIFINLRGINKLRSLELFGIERISCLYTDSIEEDFSLHKISDNTNLVKENYYEKNIP